MVLAVPSAASSSYRVAPVATTSGSGLETRAVRGNGDFFDLHSGAAGVPSNLMGATTTADGHVDVFFSSLSSSSGNFAKYSLASGVHQAFL